MRYEIGERVVVVRDCERGLVVDRGRDSWGRDCYTIAMERGDDRRCLVEADILGPA